MLSNTNYTSARGSYTNLADEKEKRVFSSINFSEKETKSITVGEFIKTGLRNQTNMRKPKFGIKYYRIQDTGTYDPYYKIPNQVKAVGKQKDRGSFMDEFLKITKPNPAAKYNILDDWTKKFDPKTGKFLKSEKLTFTGEVMR